MNEKRGYYKDINNQNKYLEELKVKFNIVEMKDWYQVGWEDFPYGFRSLYNNSYYQILKSHFQGYDWLEWKFKQVPTGTWNIKENINRFMKSLGEIKGYTKFSDWYNIIGKDFEDNGGEGLLNMKYSGSPIKAVMDYFKDETFYEWMFSCVPNGWWKIAENIKRYMNWLGEVLGYTKPEDWYSVTGKDFKDNYGVSLLNHYTIIQAVKNHFPDYVFCDRNFRQVSPHYWKDENNFKDFMMQLGKEKGYVKQEDWYEITSVDFRKINGGHSVLNYYDGSPFKAVVNILSEFTWYPWKFRQLPKFWYTKMEHCLDFLSWFANEVGYKTQEDWYNINEKILLKNYGVGILSQYNFSPCEIVMNCFADKIWHPWSFKSVSRDHWKNPNNCLNFLLWYEKENGFTKKEDWYNVKIQDLKNICGSGFPAQYSCSICKILTTFFKDFNWEEWNFHRVPKNFWNDFKNHIRYKDALSKKLGITKYEDWYDVTQEIFYDNRGGGLMGRYNKKIPKFIMATIPEFNFDIEKFTKGGETQKAVYRIVKNKYNDAKFNYKHSDLRFESSNVKMELDVFIPSLNLAIEYQGKQHFIAIPRFGGEKGLKDCQRRDIEKREKCKLNGIKLIEIHYSWDGNEKFILDQINLTSNGELNNF